MRGTAPPVAGAPDDGGTGGMEPLKTALRPFELFNDAVLPVTRALGIAAIAAMVAVTLAQVFFRYLSGFPLYGWIDAALGDVLPNGALPWPDEAARFFMLWMTGLMAPSAFRRGGFVAIDMLEMALPRRGAAALSLILLILCMIVLGFAVQLGWNHVASGWLFASSSLALPLGLIGFETIKIKLAWMYMSLLVGYVLMCVVGVELILRQIITLGGRGDELQTIQQDAMKAE